jgi:uncharacterized protein (TIGR00266 family)
MAADVIDFEIVGDDLQGVVVTLDPQEAVIAEAGGMTFMEDGIEMLTQLSTNAGQGLLGKLLGAGKRAITGESFFITFFVNNSPQRRQVAFAAPYPGKIVPVELSEHAGELICQKDAFLCAARGIDIGIALQKRLGVGFFGGEGFILQRISSPDGRGQVFLHAGGTIIHRTLRVGEVLRVDTGCLVAFERTVDYDIQMIPGIRNKLFGGEGLFYVKLTGPGSVWIQTLPFSRLADRIIAAAPRTGGKGVDEGSVLGGLGRLIDGN